MILRYCVCIPVYNNPTTIVDVAIECLQNSEWPLLIVDDGSDQPVEKLFVGRVDSFQNRIHFLRFEQNRGKGVALQEAIKWTLQRGYTHLLTLDGDGQHSGLDIKPLIEKSMEAPWSLIIGDRNMNTANVPKSSTFGKAFSNFWIKYETEKTVADSQSGYRIYPLFHVQMMRFFRKRYDFEIEILTRLLWKNVDIINVPVSVKYFPPEIRVSHFHKWKDNARISITNTVLVCLSLLNHKVSPVQSSFAVGLGVLVGVTPLYGLHTLIIAALAFGFRLNFVYMWLGSHVSLPPLVPFLLLGVGAIHASFFQTGGDPKGFFSADWLLSYLSLGTSLGLFAAICVYAVMSKKQRKPNQKKFVQNQKSHIGIDIMDFILKRFGLWPAYAALYFVVPFYFLFNFRARKSVGEYWRVIRPQIGFWSRQKKTFDLLMCFAQQMIDRAYQRKFQAPAFEFQAQFPIQQFVDELEKNRIGTIFVNGHFGGWDLPATLFSMHKSDKKLRAIMYGEKAAFHPGAQTQNQNYEATYFNQESLSILKIKADLDQGQTVALMADRPVSKSFELVLFFGKLALFDTTPFKVALTCQARLGYVFCFKSGFKTYHLDIKFKNPEKAVGLGYQEKEKLIYAMLVDYVSDLEQALTQFPEQWYNFFPFWSHLVILD